MIVINKSNILGRTRENIVQHINTRKIMLFIQQTFLRFNEEIFVVFFKKMNGCALSFGLRTCKLNPGINIYTLS